jgi:phosphoribosylamine--glycine ligase
MASEGYPGHYERDRVIRNLDVVDRMPDVKVFHAGTTMRNDPAAGEKRVVTDGGRVLNVSALGDDLARAQQRAYEAVRAIKFDGGWYRRDIAEKAVRGRK